MAIFRPEMKSGNSSYYGICEISLNSFEDKSSQFDWADIFISVTINQKGSEYTRDIKIAGSLDKDGGGNITGGSVLKRMYVFFDAIGCKAGLNVKGQWEDENGEPIANIAEYLNSKFSQVAMPDAGLDYNYLAYIYKEKPKKDGDKAWTRTYHKIYSNSEANKGKLADDVKWLKGKGVIKEATDLPVQQNGNTLQGSGLANL
tara:strand:- start:464 stop:1069 length:606 start_codon:yes stop_codon:yes gene_type:complete